ncbi:glycolate utilization protein [Phyllobacterium phragmitis]|uniref:Glycolate utilization protein n=1 Tax=Phyllobacterium phragmitis TaxID=2670329 RepID=A0A2S9IRG2_9HYPH|nr:heme-binding protein [Phyllobacterium phragmitis]PRD43107.1 glycolate utilization protein [Phyllobacterium phragmitis]
MYVSSYQARALLESAEAKARELEVPVNIVVLDAGGHLKAFHRMDGAVLASIDIAMRKAKTAALFECNSEDIWEFCKPGAAAPGLELTNGGLAPYGGGIALKCPNGVTAGAVGVSGGSIQQDMEIAQAALATFEAMLG